MPDPSPTLTIAHQPPRFVAELAGEEAGFLAYRQHGTVVDATSTFVEPAARRHGVALKLVQAFVDWVRSEELRVRPTCWYVAKVMRADPGMHALVAD